jgi:hypothetical protein
MLDCLAPNWLFDVWYWITDVDTVIKWMINNNIIFCNEVI